MFLYYSCIFTSLNKENKWLGAWWAAQLWSLCIHPNAKNLWLISATVFIFSVSFSFLDFYFSLIYFPLSNQGTFFKLIFFFRIREVFPIQWMFFFFSKSWYLSWKSHKSSNHEQYLNLRFFWNVGTIFKLLNSFWI